MFIFLNLHFSQRTPFFYKNSFNKNHQAQNYQKIKNILRIMGRLKYMINNLESPILILHQESALFTLIEMSGRKRLRLIRLIRKNLESIKSISGSFWQNSKESQGLGLIYVIVIKKRCTPNSPSKTCALALIT